MNKFLLSLALVAIALQYGAAQKKRAWVKAANQAFYEEGDYYKAFKYYDAALKYKDSTGFYGLLYHKAESARLIGAAQDAMIAYRQLLSEAPEDTLSKVPYRNAWARLGEVQLSLAYTWDPFNPGNYEQAMTSFNRYNSSGYEAESVTEDVAKGMAVINFANQDQSWFANESISPMQIFMDSSYSRYSRAPWPWAPAEDRAANRSTRFSPQFYVTGKDGQYFASATGNLPICMNTYLENTAFSQDGKRVYFSTCESDPKSETLSTQCGIYYLMLDGQGNPTGERQEVPGLTAAGSIQLQPALSWDEAGQREVMHFVSNRAGGRGGMDIWKSEYDEESGRFLPPTNEGSVNTADDEMTPFFQNNVLYFSSNGYADRYGGFDLFSWNPMLKAPRNMGQKVNSSADDFGYSRNFKGDKAFFISNRQSIFVSNAEQEEQCRLPGALGCCCLNTYAYDIEPCVLEIVTVSNCDCPEDYSCEPLPGPKVLLFDITENPEVSEEAGIGPSSISENVYLFNDRLRPGRKYRVMGRYEGENGILSEWSKIFDFTEGLGPCEANGGTTSDTIPFKCKSPYLTVEVFGEGNVRLPDATVRLVDITDGQAITDYGNNPRQEEMGDEPCGPAGKFLDPIPGEISIKAFTPHQVDFDRTYLVLAHSKNNKDWPLKMDTVILSRDDAAFCGLACEKPVRILLEPTNPIPPDPIQVFFDNARPRWQGYPSGNRDISAVPYLTSLERYKGLQNTYVGQFDTGDPTDALIKVGLEETFFPNEVNQKEKEFKDFVKQVKQLLCAGQTITVQAIGCTSPKFKRTGVPDERNFNDNLANRRVESVQQDFESLGLTEAKWPGKYNFVQAFDTTPVEEAGPCDQLGSIKRPPLVPLNVLQDQTNKKYSVYSFDAAIARKVVIQVSFGPPSPSQ